jgi:hypothetical protein
MRVEALKLFLALFAGACLLTGFNYPSTARERIELDL